MWKPGSYPPPSSSSSSYLGIDRNLTESSNESFSLPFSSSSTSSHTSSSTSSPKSSLPIAAHRLQILSALEQFKVVVIVGETGSGKSTQIPQYLLESGWCNNAYKVVVTQPRRIAAMTLAQRVAFEQGVEVGKEVGYAVRFDEKCCDDTKIKFITDGLLVRETLGDVLLQQYSVVMVDEAHERNISVDLLLGLLKKIRIKRPNLRIIICSATIDAESFLRFFTNGQSGEGVIISIDGRRFPVETLYLQNPCSSYIQSAVDTVTNIHSNSPVGGDILVFLPTAEDIESAILLTQEKVKDNNTPSSSKLSYSSSSSSSKHKYALNAMPLYASLPLHMQTAALQKAPPNSRNAIFATTIAETSVTIPNVKYVVDCGFVKLPFYDAERGFERLVVTKVSKASARQRAGRAGRTSPGQCYRLYSREAYLKFDPASPPEIQRTSLASLVLTMKALGIDNIMNFDLLTPPSVNSLAFALEELYGLGALDDDAKLTDYVGVLMAEFPVEPRDAKMLISSVEHGCIEECIGIAAILQVQDIFLYARSAAQKRDRDLALAGMVDRSGDHVTFAKILEQCDWRNQDTCKDLFLNYRAMSRADEIRKQLRRFMRRLAKRDELPSSGTSTSHGVRSILLAVAQGLLFNIAKLANDGKYRTVRGGEVVEISPNSVFAQYGKVSDYVVYHYTEDSPKGEGLLRLAIVSAVSSRDLVSNSSAA